MLVSNTLLVNGIPLPNAFVESELIAPGPVFYGDTAVVKDQQTSTNAAGKWTFDLIPNLALNPSGTLYRIREFSRTRNAEPTVYIIYVPDTGTEYTVDQLITNQESPYEFTGGTIPPTQRIDNIIVVSDSTTLPVVGNADGDLATSTDTDTLWQWDGTQWRSVSKRTGTELPTENMYPGEPFYNTATNEEYVYNGDTWVLQGGSGTPGTPVSELLAVKSTSGGSSILGVSSSTLVDLFGVEMEVTFKAPSTGIVLVRLTGMGIVQAGVVLCWGLLEGISEVPGSRMFVMEAPALEPGFEASEAISRATIIGGLVPGSNHTWRWGHARVVGSNNCATAFGSGDMLPVYDYYGGQFRGPLVMEVWSVAYTET